jgi:hypothetical protein
MVFAVVYLPAGSFGVWYSGFASPVRLLTPVVPVLALGIANMLDAGGWRAWKLFSVLALPSFPHAYLMTTLPSFTRYGESMTEHNFFIACFERATHLDLILLSPSLRHIGPKTWMTTGIYLLAIVLLCILMVRRNAAHSTGDLV